MRSGPPGPLRESRYNVTIREWLNKLAASNTSTVEDSQIMQNLLRQRVGLPRAKVVYGVVYPAGHGRQVSIQAMAKKLLSPGTGRDVKPWPPRIPGN